MHRVLLHSLLTLAITSTLLLLPALAGPGDPSSNKEPPDPGEFPADLLDTSKYAGKVILLDFWASWCVPCGESFPWMDRMRRAHESRGLAVVTVNLDEDEDDALEFLKRHPFDLQVIRDPEGRLASWFDLQVMPTSILFDRSGKAVLRHEGFRAEKAGDYERNLTALLDGKATGVEGFPGMEPPNSSRRAGVKPWQKGLLAKRAMFLDCDPLDLSIDDHIYFSKEASSGGRGFGGGGCGCN